MQASGSTRGHVRAFGGKWEHTGAYLGTSGRLGAVHIARAGLWRHAGERGAQGYRVSQRHWVENETLGGQVVTCWWGTGGTCIGVVHTGLQAHEGT